MDHNIQPDRITKPIQLLAAWLAGLLAIDSCFLIAAARLPVDSWASQALTVAAIVNVPLFLLAVFLLQTKFRPELQEDLYYSSYISQKTNVSVQVPKIEIEAAVTQRRVEVAPISLDGIKREDKVLALGFEKLKFGINFHLNEASEIARLLGREGVLKYSSFGGEEAPVDHVVAISAGLPDELQKAVLRLAAEAGFKKFSYIQEYGENIDEDVLFGSYGEVQYNLTPWSAS